jgi:hypothetical protein
MQEQSFIGLGAAMLFYSRLKYFQKTAFHIVQPDRQFFLLWFNAIRFPRERLSDKDPQKKGSFFIESFNCKIR